MRIWVFPSFYPSPLKGRAWNGIFTHRQNKALQQLGAEVRVVQPVMYKWPWPFSMLFTNKSDQHQRSLPRSRWYDGIEIFHPVVSDPRPHRFVKSTYDERYIRSVERWIRRAGIRFDKNDFFLAQYIPEAGLVLKLGRKLGVKTGVMVIGDDVWVEPGRNEGARRFFIQTMKEADIRFSVAESLAAESRAICNAWLDFTIVRRGVNHAIFKPVSQHEREALRRRLGLPQEALLVLAVGTLIERKGWFELLDAFAAAAAVNPQLRLVAVHAGETAISMADELHKRGITDKVIDAAQVDPSGIHEYYQAADLFALVSHWEGISNAVAEAMSSGLPVITTIIPGHQELITHGENGWFVPVKSPADIQSALLTLAADKALRTRLGQAARTFIVEQWGDYLFNSRKIMEAFHQPEAKASSRASQAI